jgi:uncharacterized protein
MRVNKIDIKLDEGFSRLDGIRILHISDLHLMGRNRKIESYFKKLETIESDFVLITGDLIDSDKGIEWCAKYLKKLPSRFGAFACLGNHDRFDFNILQVHPCFFHLMGRPKENNLELLARKLKENGIQILINEKKTVNINSARLTIVGADEDTAPLKRLLSNIPQGEYVILLSHMPDLLKELGHSKLNLALSGHTHGGQIRLPFIGPIVAFSSFQRKYNRGLYNYDGYYLNVSGGLGVARAVPIRLFCPPEATLLTLRKQCQKLL